MHITEGIITGSAAVLYTAAGVGLVSLGVFKMKRFVREVPENKPLLGMGVAIIFFISLIPIPAFTGSCSHPSGTPLVAILLGPAIGFALTGASLLLQAAFFAHGGFGTWGANLLALGFCGCISGWGAFRVARMLRLPLWAAGMAGGFFGNIMVYAASGLLLGFALSDAPDPRYSLQGYLLVIYSAYLPTQLPIAVGEMLLTGFALHYANLQRPEVLAELGVTRASRRATVGTRVGVLVFALLVIIGFGNKPDVACSAQRAIGKPELLWAASASPGNSRYGGLDEVVNERLAEDAGLAVRTPYLDTESWGDLWNLLLLAAGGACGFVVGRWWHLLWGGNKRDGRSPKK